MTAGTESAQAPKARDARAVALALLALVIAVAAFVRFHGLASDSFWRDEAASWAQAQGSFLDIIRQTAQDNYPPLHNFLLAVTMKIGGDGVWMLRLPSAVLGILSVAAVYWVGAIAGGRAAGLIAALLLTLSPFAIYYSQEARPYAVLLATGLAFAGSTFTFQHRPSPAWAAAVFLSGVALLYSHPYGAFTWLGIAGATFGLLLFQPSRYTARALEWGLLQLAIAVAFLPWAIVLIGRANHIEATGFWIPYPSYSFVVGTLFEVASGGVMLILLTAAAVLAFVAPARSGAASGPPAAAPRLRLVVPDASWVLLAWLLVPAVLGVALSLVRTPVFYDRYLIASLPPLLILAGMGLSRFITGRVAAAAVGVIAVAAALLGYFRGTPPPQHEDWRSVAAYIDANLPPDGCLLLVDWQAANIIHYYERRPICLLYPDDMPATTATHVVAVLAGSGIALLHPALTSPAWQVGDPVQFLRVEVVPMTRVSEPD